MLATVPTIREAVNVGDSVFLGIKKFPHYDVSLTDAEIVIAIRQGHEPSFEQVFRTYYERLCHYAHSLLKDQDDAEEMVQTVFLNVWEKREELEITLSLKAYLYRAVHNHCLNRLKHYKVREAHREYTVYYQPEGYEPVADALNGYELEERIEQAVSRLPEQCQLVFRMSRFEELKYQEIADRLRISVKTVENQIGKALRVLRNELSDYLPSLLWVGTCLLVIRYSELYVG